MSIGALDAASAYGRVTGGSKVSIGSAGGAGDTGESGFAGLVENFVGDAAQAMRHAEQASAKQVAGKGDLIDVVTAIGAAEMALDTVVAVRDRVVNAYSDIMRMQI